MSCEYSDKCFAGWIEIAYMRLGLNYAGVYPCRCQGKGWSEMAIQSNIPKAYSECTLEGFRTQTGYDTDGKKLSIPNCLNNSDSFVFSGEPGVGKSHLLYALAVRDLNAKRNIKVFTETSWYRHVNSMAFNSERVPDNWILQMLGLLDGFYLDDLGKAKITDASRASLFELLDCLEKAGTRFVISTNLTNFDKLGGEDLTGAITRRLQNATIIGM